MKLLSNLKIHLKGYFFIGKELLEFFWNQKLWWMIPFIVVLFILTAILIFAQVTPLGPLVYTFF